MTTAKQLSGSEICRLLDVLIGKNEPVGSTHIDHARLINLKNLIEVTNWCLDGVLRSACSQGTEYSVAENREMAIKAINTWYEWTQTVVKECEG